MVFNMRRVFFSLPLFFLIIGFFINVGYCTVDITTVDDNLATRLGTSTTVAGLILTSVVLMMFVLPVAMVSRNLIPTLIIGIPVHVLAIALGWCPTFTLVLEVLLISSMWASKISSVFT